MANIRERGGNGNVYICIDTYLNYILTMKTVTLQSVEWPAFGTCSAPPPPALAEIENRLARCRDYMLARNLTHLVVYGDREHFANLMYLTHFDPRFEEALLILRNDECPLLLVGNECEGHLPVSPLYAAGKLRHERYQPFSLLNQPRNGSRSLEAIFKSEGFGPHARAGCAGWKYFTDTEFEEARFRIELPSYITDILRSLCGHTQVVNATDLLMAPSYGLRSTCSVYEIACFEHANILASEGMIHLLKNFKAGLTDFELVQLYRYCGYPLNCHIGMKSSGNQHYGLSSPVGSVIRKGDPCSTNIGYWGSNICRAGWVARNENDLPPSARGYIENFAAPYFSACAAWYSRMRPGTKGKELRELIDRMLPFEQFGVFLNPGHLSHLDEWLSSPVYAGSDEELRSGMYMQVDIIPRSKTYFSSRMEEGIVIADAALREQLKEHYPEVYARCMARREFMINTLGFDLPEEVLPLSNMPGIVPPFFLDHTHILTLQ